MPKSELFSSLQDIFFAEKDPEIITSEIISQYENLAGRSLAQGDPVRVFLDSIILAVIQLRSLIDYAAKQNLLAYASGPFLDHLGALLGVYRLPAARSAVTLEFKLSAPLPSGIIIPAGTRATPGGNIYFAVENDTVIPAGSLAVSASALCTETGSEANGYIPGQINKIVDVFPYEMSVSNISPSSGGSEIENDENFRERIITAPESFSAAGPKNAYKFFALGAHPDIIDAAVLTPPDTQPGCVEIYPLMTGGNIPGAEIISAVYNACNGNDIRPDTDFLTVKKPEIFSYDINVLFWIDNKNSASGSQITAAVNEAVQNFALWQKSQLGRDVNPSELNRRILDAGAKRCDIISPSFHALKSFQLAFAENILAVFQDFEES